MSNALIDNETTIADVRPPKRRLKRLILLVVVPLIAALVVGVVYLKGGRYVETDNAYIKADKVPVSAAVSGTVTEVLVDENQSVNAGQPLFRLDPAPFQVAVAKAEAKLAQVRTDLAALKASYRERDRRKSRWPESSTPSPRKTSNAKPIWWPRISFPLPSSTMRSKAPTSLSSKSAHWTRT
jgi:multidrug resistance efflux pump